MGKLVTETPYSEITATLELLDCFGVERDDLTKFRKGTSYIQQEVARLIKYGEAHTANSSAGIVIDRTAPFNPAMFIGEGWTIWKGHAKGNGLEGGEEQDKRSLALLNVDLSNVRFETRLKLDESYITGKERLRRQKASGNIRLDAKVLETLWLNQHLIPESWKEKTNGNTTFIFFDGTVLRYPNGNRCTLYLYWNDGEWHWDVHWLDDFRYGNNPSAVLA